MTHGQQQQSAPCQQPPWTMRQESESPEWGSTRATAEELAETMIRKPKYAREWAE